MTDNELTPISELSLAALDVQPQDRDWSEGYPEDWDYLEAPACPACGEYARWISQTDFRDELTEDQREEIGLEHSSEDWTAWRCPNLDCANVGDEIDRFEAGSEGPMMNYSYELPDTQSYDESDAAKIAHLPLCIVREDGMYSATYSLALTGGGMDLSWQICEAFMRLGFLPPLHYADLPRMAGQPRGETDDWIVEGCKQTFREGIGRAQRSYQHSLDKLEGMTNPTEGAKA